MSNKARMLAHSPRGTPPTEELLEDPATLPAMPRDEELELNAGELEETAPARARPRKGKR